MILKWLPSILLAILFVLPIPALGTGPDDDRPEGGHTRALNGNGTSTMSDLGFVENRGQWSQGPMFMASTRFGSIGASASSMSLNVKGGVNGSSWNVLGVHFPGSALREPSGSAGIDTSINFILGKGATGTVTKGYEKVTYNELWPGIDMVVSLEDGLPKYEFVLDPGADPSMISLSIEGAVSIRELGGAIVIQLPGGGVVVDSAPDAYYVGSDGTVDVRYRMIDAISYGFSVSGHDRTRSMVIDPLVYSTFVGGGGWDQGKSIVTDDGLNAYFCGHTDSMDLPATPGAYDEGGNGNIDGYVARLSSDGSSLDWCTFFGGSSDDYCHEVALRGSNGVVICGHSYSGDLPVTDDAFDGTYNGMLDTYVAVLSRDGSLLEYCTYVGGQDNDYAYSLAVDHMGVATVAGCTFSSDIPTTEGAYQRAKAGDADCLVYSLDGALRIGFITLIGGAMEDRAYDVSVDDNGRPWIAGTSYSSDYPTTEGALDRSHNGGADAFLTAIDRDGGSLIVSSIYGGTGMEGANSIAISRSGQVAIAGRTTSNGLAMAANAFDPSFNGKADAYVAGFGPDVGKIAFSTYFGGSEVDDVAGISFDGSGNIYLAGYSGSNDLPTTSDALYSSLSGGFYDETIAVLDGDATSLVYSTFLGGSSSFDYLYDISINDLGSLFAVGNTASTDHPASSGAYDRSFSGGEDIVVISLDLGLPYTPTPPRDLASSIEDDAVHLTWVAPLDNGTSGPISYDVYRGQDPYSLVPVAEDVRSTSYDDHDLAPGGTYHYAIRAKNDIGRSRVSNIAQALFLTVPSPPGDLSASAGPGHVSLSWVPPSSDGGASLLGYEVWRRTAEHPSTLTASTGPSQTGYNDTSVVQGIEYFYTVAAVNPRGTSRMSLEASATPMDRPGPPSDLEAISGDGYVTLSWGPPISDGGSPLLAYEIWRSGTEGSGPAFSLGPAETGFNDTGLTNGETYTYHMTARNLAGRSGPSNELSVVPAGVPDPPRDLRARAGDGYVLLTWQPPLDDGGFAVTSFNVLRSCDGSDPTEAGTADGRASAFNDTDVENGHRYAYWVVAVTSIGASSLVGPAEGFPIGPPCPPIDLTAVPGDHFVLVSWDPPSTDGGACVDRYSVLRGLIPGSMKVLATVGNRTFSYNDTSVVNGIAYHYSVRAYNPFYGSDPSGTVAVLPLGLPTAPTDVEAELVSGLGRITWNPPSDDGGADIECYRILKTSGADGPGEIIELGPGVLNYVDANVTQPGTIYYSLTCRNRIGDSSSSDKVSITIDGVPGIVGSLKAVLSDGGVTITWDPPSGPSSVSSYKVYRTAQGSAPVLIGTTQGTQTHFIDAYPVPGRSSYSIRAVNERGMGEASEPVEVSVPSERSEGDNGWIFLASSILLFALSCSSFLIWMLGRRRR